MCHPRRLFILGSKVPSFPSLLVQNAFSCESRKRGLHPDQGRDHLDLFLYHQGKGGYAWEASSAQTWRRWLRCHPSSGGAGFLECDSAATISLRVLVFPLRRATPRVLPSSSPCTHCRTPPPTSGGWCTTMAAPPLSCSTSSTSLTPLG